MNRLLISLLFIISTFRSISQNTLTKQDYLKKSKNQKTAAWVMLGGGLTVAVGAAILDVSGDWTKSDTPYMVAVYTGGASMLGSIPLFIAAGKNKRKAMNMAFRFQSIQLSQGSWFLQKKIPSLRLGINL